MLSAAAPLGAPGHVLAATTNDAEGSGQHWHSLVSDCPPPSIGLVWWDIV